MEKLSEDELKNIDGGFELGIGTITLISIGVPLVVGIIDGFIRPLKCN